MLLRRPPVFVSWLLILIGFVATLTTIQVLNPTPAQAYCLYGYGNQPCYRVGGGWDPGDYDVAIYVKCPNTGWNFDNGIMWLYEAYHSGYYWNSDGRFNADPSHPSAYYFPCSNTYNIGITAIKIDPMQAPYGQVMCRSAYANFWPGLTWTKVSHDDGTWRNFPTAASPMHDIECKTTRR